MTTNNNVLKAHISNGNSKLGKIANWSLAPVKTCSAEACKTCAKEGCYALKSYRAYPSTRRAWDENTQLAMQDLPALEAQLGKYFAGLNAPRFFRVHVAGDFFSTEYAAMWARVAAAAPHTNFLAFTKQWDPIRNVNFPDNFTVVLSAWPGTTVPADLRKLYRVAWVDDGSGRDPIPENALECPGNCETCGACWKLDRDTVFHKH